LCAQKNNVYLGKFFSTPIKSIVRLKKSCMPQKNIYLFNDARVGQWHHADVSPFYDAVHNERFDDVADCGAAALLLGEHIVLIWPLIDRFDWGRVRVVLVRFVRGCMGHIVNLKLRRWQEPIWAIALTHLFHVRYFALELVWLVFSVQSWQYVSVCVESDPIKWNLYFIWSILWGHEQNEIIWVHFVFLN